MWCSHFRIMQIGVCKSCKCPRDLFCHSDWILGSTSHEGSIHEILAVYQFQSMNIAIVHLICEHCLSAPTASHWPWRASKASGCVGPLNLSRKDIMASSETAITACQDAHNYHSPNSELWAAEIHQNLGNKGFTQSQQLRKTKGLELEMLKETIVNTWYFHHMLVGLSENGVPCSIQWLI